MKISKYLGTFALLAMLAACSTVDEQVRFAGDEVKVNATIGGESVFTRSNPIGSTEEQSEFQDFDQIGINRILIIMSTIVLTTDKSEQNRT